MIRQVATGVLMVKIDGVERNFCHFSNTRMEGFCESVVCATNLRKMRKLQRKIWMSRSERTAAPNGGMIYPDQERKVCPKCMDKKSILLRVMAYFIPYKKSLIIMILCYLGTAALNLIWPYLNGTILYDKVLAKDEEFLAFCIFQRDVL